MNCPYCAKQISKYTGASNADEQRFRCYNCECNLNFHTDGSLLEVTMLLQDYHFFINHKEQTFEVSKKKILPVKAPNIIWIPILSINSVPQHFTPSNALEKLKLFLLFS